MSISKIVILETFEAIGEQSSNSRRLRPIAGQNLSANARVSFCLKTRYAYPVGTKFKAKAKITDREGGTQYIYTNPNQQYIVVTDEEAEAFINKNF